MSHTSLAITWTLTSISGYGVYGLQIALQFLRRGGQKFIATHRPGPVLFPALTQVRINPVLALAQKISDAMAQKPDELLTFNHPVLYAVGNECGGFPGQDRVRGSLNVGCAAIEHAHFSAHALDYVKNYDMLISISKWNDAFLRSLGQIPVHLCHQGIDTSIFTPSSSSGLWEDRFIVFSGGKFEFRKGQDIVTAAFREFHKKHPEALLVTAWQNTLPQDPEPFELAGHCVTVPQIEQGKGLKITPWLLEQGLPQGSFIELPFTPNYVMPAILRDCHAAIFPNRCEGGTNLVAMEAMACGLPTYVANNTGQKDLVEMLDAPAFTDQRLVRQGSRQLTTQDWGETSVEEVIESLEKIYTNYQSEKAAALVRAEKLKAWDWGPQNETLLQKVCDGD